jgi:hypothetical protein
MQHGALAFPLRRAGERGARGQAFVVRRARERRQAEQPRAVGVAAGAVIHGQAVEASAEVGAAASSPYGASPIVLPVSCAPKPIATVTASYSAPMPHDALHITGSMRPFQPIHTLCDDGVAPCSRRWPSTTRIAASSNGEQ